MKRTGEDAMALIAEICDDARDECSPFGTVISVTVPTLHVPLAAAGDLSTSGADATVDAAVATSPSSSGSASENNSESSSSSSSSGSQRPCKEGAVLTTVKVAPSGRVFVEMQNESQARMVR
jgi:hypothetical protein